MLVLDWFTNNKVIAGLQFQYNRHMEVVRLINLRPGRFCIFWYPWYTILLEAK